MGREDPIRARIDRMWNRIRALESRGDYPFQQPISELDGPWVEIGGERMLMFATYSYLGLIRHPRIVAAARDAVARYGTGTHGVRLLGGTLDLHQRMEARIAAFAGREDAVVFSSGYVTNLTTIGALVGRGDWVLSDRWNHASIVDGCLLSPGAFHRFEHNDMDDLERLLRVAPDRAGKLVVADAVFSMDGDIFDLPAAVELCRAHGARLMIDEAHSLGLLGPTGRGIEEHFGMPGTIDIRMGTLSKAIPGVGGFIAGDRRLVAYLRHTARGFVFSAATVPAVAATVIASLDVLEEEGAALKRRLQRNVDRFLGGLRAAGFDTGRTATAIVPILVGTEERAMAMTRICREQGVFVLPVLPPAVPQGTARLRATVTAAHGDDDIDAALEVFVRAGRTVGAIG